VIVNKLLSLSLYVRAAGAALDPPLLIVVPNIALFLSGSVTLNLRVSVCV